MKRRCGNIWAFGLALLSVSLVSRAEEVAAPKVETSPVGTILRVLMVQAPVNGSQVFKPGPPIPESSLKSEADFVAYLRSYNRRWKIQLLGKLTNPTASMASAETSDAKFSVGYNEATLEPNGEIKISARLDVKMTDTLNRFINLRGAGLSSQDCRTSRLPNMAQMILGHASDRSPQQIVVFLTLTQPEKKVETTRNRATSRKIRIASSSGR